MKRGLTRNAALVAMIFFNLNFAWFAYIVAWLDRKLRFRMPFPRDTGELSRQKEWCIKTLKKNNALPTGAVIMDYRVIPFKQEYIFRSNIGRLEIDYNLNGENKTFMCMAKFAPVSGTVWNRAIFNMQLNHLKEIYFNQYFVGDKEVSAPAAYYAEFGLVTGNLCLMMEYMGDDKEYEEGEIENILQEDFESALDAMASLHARYWKSTEPKMARIFPIITATVDFFDWMVAGKWSIAARKILVQSWCYCSDPQTVLHGDARIGNMMFPISKDCGRFVFIDWQAVRRGKAAFDLAYFLVLSLMTHKRKELEQGAIDFYYQRLYAKGVKDYSREQLEEDYRHSCLCVLVLLALPMLSGEASAEGEGAKVFAWGMNIWRERMEAKFEEFDYTWLANRYGIAEGEAKAAIAEMLKVMDVRLKGINAGAAV